MSTWTQDGFAVVSKLEPEAGQVMPLMHSFHLPKWEADSALAALAGLPEHLRKEAQVVPARLTFELP